MVAVLGDFGANRAYSEERAYIARISPVGQKHRRVSFHDLEDTVHSVEVTAGSFYEAVARGVKALQSNAWSGPGAFQVSYVDVTVKEPEVTHRVNLNKFNEWLDRERGSPRDRSQRQRVRSILNS
jgi:hypothetical protein